MNLLKILYKANRLRWRITRPLTVGVRILLIRDGYVTLVRHTYQDSWYLPGGGVEKRETLEQAIRRELKDEAREWLIASLRTEFPNGHDWIDVIFGVIRS